MLENKSNSQMQITLVKFFIGVNKLGKIANLAELKTNNYISKHFPHDFKIII